MHPPDQHTIRGERGLRVVIAPDSFKGSASAATVARCLAQGWRHVRPADEVVELPLADGGEGTLDAVLSAVAGAREMVLPESVPGPLGTPTKGRWLRLADTALVELADCCGLQWVADPNPDTALRAASDGLGTVLRAALADGVTSVVVAIGGSASTDGGLGVLRALGLRAIDGSGRELTGGGGDLAAITHLDWPRRVTEVPVLVLTDVTAPLLGPDGAAQVFGPQKGADPTTVAALETGLRHWAGLWTARGVSETLLTMPGAGAAGGIGYGLAAAVEARLTSGASWVAEQVGLTEALSGADVLITGEGSFDRQSLTGKLVGHLLEQSGRVGRTWVVAGRIGEVAAVPAALVSLSVLAGSSAAALADPERWLIEAGRQVASAARPG